jgi:ubiquinol-cytochrome c reductase cytochrome b subunit
MTSKQGWWEARTGLGSSLRKTLDEDIPGGAKFAYALGSATLLTFLTLAVTGIWELFYYVPSVSQAYDSVNFIRFQVPFGWLVHGIHFWAANVMVVLVLLHLAQAFIWGAFKKPRELTWVLGACLLLATLGSVFTGGPLAWDEKGYWAANVGSELTASIPVVGQWLQRLVFATQPVGQLTLSRLFPLHIALIPIVILGILALHMVTFRKGGAAGSIKETEKVGAFYPDQVIMDLLVFSGVLTLLVWLSARLMTPVTGPADPVDPTFVARPDWPFLWLFQLLKYLNGPLEWIGFILIPLVVVGLVFLVPWLDRRPERSPARRPVAMAMFAVVLVLLGGLTYLGASEKSPTPTAPSGTPPATPDSAIESTPVAPLPTVASTTIGSAEHGQVLFVAYCQACHGAEGKGGVQNPQSADGTIPEINPIDPEISGKQQPFDVQFFVDNVDNYIQNGSVPDPDQDGNNPKYKMPSFGNTYTLSQPQIADVEAYVLALNNTKRAVIVKPGVDPQTYAWWTLGGFLVVAVVSAAALIGGRKRRR